MIQRRQFLGGLISALAAPAIVKAESLMPVKLVSFEPTIIVPPGHTIEAVANGWHRISCIENGYNMSMMFKSTGIGKVYAPALEFRANALAPAMNFAYADPKGLYIAENQTFDICGWQMERVRKS